MYLVDQTNNMAQSISITPAPIFRPSTSALRRSTSTTVSVGGGNSPTTTTGGSSGQINASVGVNIGRGGVSFSRPSLNISSAPSILSTASGPRATDTQGNRQIGTGEAVSAGLAVAEVLRGGGPRTAVGIADVAARSLGVNTNMSARQAIDTLAPGVLSGVTNQISSTISQAISGINFPNLNFPGLGEIMLILGAGPKWLLERILSKIAIPPFIPGLTFNPAMVGAAISIIKIIASGNVGEVAKALLEDLIEDIKEQSGIAELEEQIRDQIAEVQGFIDDIENIKENGLNIIIDGSIDLLNSAENQFVDNYNRENPDRTETDEEGNEKVIKAPPPDTSQFEKFKESLKEVGNIVASPVVQLASNVSNASSQVAQNVGNTDLGGAASRIGSSLASAASQTGRNLTNIVSFSTTNTRTPSPTSTPTG